MKKDLKKVKNFLHIGSFKVESSMSRQHKKSKVDSRFEVFATNKLKKYIYGRYIYNKRRLLYNI